MAKVVCEDCGEVIAEGVDQDTAEDLADAHTHGDNDRIIDRRSDRDTYDTEGGGGPGMDGIVNPSADEARADADTESAGDVADEAVQETTDEASVEDELAAMDAMDGDRDPSDWWDVSDDADYEEVDDEFFRRFERVQREVEKDRSVVGDMLDHREERLQTSRRAAFVAGDERFPGDRHVPHSEYLRAQEEWRRLSEDVQDAFRKLKSREARVASRKGDDLNMKAINQRAAGDKSQTRLFTRKQQIAKGDRAVGVSCDFSGSMHEDKVKMALAAVAEATEIIGDDLVANCWTKDSGNRFGLARNKTTLGLICGPDESFEWGNMDAFSVGGGTPTADGIDQITDLLDDMTAREKVAIVVTDGKPNVEYGGGSWDEKLTGDATRDAARVVRKARQDGMKVIGLGVGGVNERQMGRIFGPDGYVMASMDDLARRLVDLYRQQLRVD